MLHLTSLLPHLLAILAPFAAAQTAAASSPVVESSGGAVVGAWTQTWGGNRLASFVSGLLIEAASRHLNVIMMAFF